MMKFLVLAREVFFAAILHLSLQKSFERSIGFPHTEQCLCFGSEGASPRYFDKQDPFQVLSRPYLWSRKAASNLAARSRNALSFLENAASLSLSISISPITPLEVVMGTTISDRVEGKHIK